MAIRYSIFCRMARRSTVALVRERPPKAQDVVSSARLDREVESRLRHGSINWGCPVERASTIRRVPAERMPHNGDRGEEQGPGVARAVAVVFLDRWANEQRNPDPAILPRHIRRRRRGPVGTSVQGRGG